MNTMGVFPGSQESGTTIITYLFTPPDVSLPNSWRRRNGSSTSTTTPTMPSSA